MLAVRFMMEADSDPGLLVRLLQPFARRSLVPERMWSHRIADMVHVEIAALIPQEDVHLIEGNLGQVIGIRSVTRLNELRKAA